MSAQRTEERRRLEQGRAALTARFVAAAKDADDAAAARKQRMETRRRNTQAKVAYDSAVPKIEFYPGMPMDEVREQLNAT